MSTGPGIFITIECINSSTKQQQLTMLANRLQRSGYDVAVFHFPQRNQASSYFIKQYEADTYGDQHQLSPYTVALFYTLDRYEAAPQIRQALAQGKIVLSDGFTGTDMASQGVKFAKTEERRGYFIWLDNLGSGMLQIPRPTMSFVLRMPAGDDSTQIEPALHNGEHPSVLQTSPPGNSNGVQRIGDVYNDLTQLFPKDFQPIDCGRNGKPLAPDVMHTILWDKVTQLLPETLKAADGLVGTITYNTSTDVPQATTHDALATSAVSAIHSDASQLMVTLPEASELLARLIQASGTAITYDDTVSPPSIHGQKDVTALHQYYIPKNYTPAVGKQYKKQLDTIVSTYSAMLAPLTDYLERQATAVPAAQRTQTWQADLSAAAAHTLEPLLPVAIRRTFKLRGSPEELSDLANRLLQLELPEAQDAALAILHQANLSLPAISTTKERETRQKTLAGSQLSATYAPITQALVLIQVLPRNELEALPTMLYTSSDLPIHEVEAAIGSWPYAQKAALFTDYLHHINRNLSNPMLIQFRYSWEVMSDYLTMSKLHQGGVKQQEHQTFSPRYGYSTPTLVDQAGLSDMFETCFAASLELYSYLQAEGHTVEAQYATLLGHRQRWKIDCTAQQILELYHHAYQHNTSDAYTDLAQAMYNKVGEVHPLLAAALQVADKSGIGKNVEPGNLLDLQYAGLRLDKPAAPDV